MTSPKNLFKILFPSFFILFPIALYAQVAVPVGSGSYASSVPGGTPYQVYNIDAAAIYKTAGVTGPFPSNDWWTTLLTSQYSGGLWAQPLDIEANSGGVKVYMPNDWVNGLMQRDGGIQISGTGFTPSAANVSGWGDWTVSFHAGRS